MARKYTRDNRGRFASSGGGATARGGRLKTAAGNKRATQTMSAKGAGGPAGTIAKGGNGVRGSVARSLAATRKPAAAPAKAAPKAAPKRIEGPLRTGGTRSRLSGQKMSEGAGKRGKARQERQAAMAGMRGMLGRTKPGASAEPLSTGGTLASRASLTRARSKAGAAGASPAQRGAATRANTYAKASVQRNTVALKGGGISGTIAKPKAAKPAAPAQAKAAPKAPKGKKADYAGAVALLSSQKAAINRMKQPMQTFNGNAAWGRNVDRIRAKSTPMQNAQRDIKGALGSLRRTQGTAKNQYASQQQKERAKREIPRLRKAVVKATRTARALKPEFAAETKRRFQARQAK